MTVPARFFRSGAMRAQRVASRQLAHAIRTNQPSYDPMILRHFEQCFRSGESGAPAFQKQTPPRLPSVWFNHRRE